MLWRQSNCIVTVNNCQCYINPVASLKMYFLSVTHYLLLYNYVQMTWNQLVVTCADMTVRKWLWTVEWCWESVCGTSLWRGSSSSLRTSTTSSVTWSSRPLTSPQTPSPHSRWASTFSLYFRTVYIQSSYHFFSSFFFQDLLTRHKIMCADFLEKNYDRVSFAYILFLSLNKSVLIVSFTSFLNCLTGFHRVWEAPTFWELCHQTAVFEGESSLSNLHHP